jgi:hypothetical protein
MANSAPQNTLRHPNILNTDPDHLNIDPGSPLVPQLVEDAALRGRTDLVGVSWQQDGLTYTVSAYDKLLKEREVKKRDKLPTFHLGVGGDLADGQAKHDWPGVNRRVRKETQEYLRSRHTIDVRDNEGNLVAIKSFLDDGLIKYLGSHDNSDEESPQHIDSFTWSDAPETPLAERPRTQVSEVNIPLHGSKNIFEQVMDHQRELKDRGDGRFNDWVGLTWQHDGKKYQIVRDVLVQHSNHGRTKKVRTWIAKFYDENGHVLGRQTFKDNELRKYFEGTKSTPQKPLIDLHWEASNTPSTPHPNQLSWAGWLATHPVTGSAQPARRRNIKLSRDLLAFQDIDVGSLVSTQEELRKYQSMLEEFIAQPRNHKFIQPLAETLTEFGHEAVITLASDLRDSYLNAVNMLGLPTPQPERVSIGGIVWGLILERYSAQHPNDAEAHYVYDIGPRGRLVLPRPEHVDPFGHSIKSQTARREMVDRATATEFLSQAFDVDFIPQQEWTSDDQEKPEIKIHRQYKLKPGVEHRIQEFVKDDVIKILNAKILNKIFQKGTQPDEFTVDELNTLGRLLREQFIQ